MKQSSIPYTNLLLLPQLRILINLRSLIKPTSRSRYSSPSASQVQQDAEHSSSQHASGSARRRSSSSVHRCCSHSVTRTETLLKHAMTFLTSLGRVIMPVVSRAHEHFSIPERASRCCALFASCRSEYTCLLHSLSSAERFVSSSAASLEAMMESASEIPKGVRTHSVLSSRQNAK